MARVLLLVSLVVATGCVQQTTTLTVTVSGDGSGVVTSDPVGIECGGDAAGCSMSVAADGVARLIATHGDGVVLAEWSGACKGAADCYVDGSDDVTVDARFERYRTLTIETSGAGTYAVTSVPDAVDCHGGICTYLLPPRTIVTLVATPQTHTAFLGWIGACADTPMNLECKVELKNDMTIGARFAPTVQVSVVLTGTGTGSVSTVYMPGAYYYGFSCPPQCDAWVPMGSMLTLHAQPMANSTFAGWTDGGCVGTSDCTIAVTSTVVVQANFAD